MSRKPNIILITTHDTGRHFGCYGVETVHTPTIDRLAAAGTRFSNYFTVTPICSASRAAMLTGRYPQSNGLMTLIHSPWDWTLNDDECHLAELLREQGYRTNLFHFQHESLDWQGLGFDAYHARRENGHRPTAPEVAGEVAAFLENQGDADQPFYAQIGFFETHTPFDFGGVGPDTENGITIPPYILDDARARDHFALLQGAVRQVDKAVEIIEAGLKNAGMVDDTLFIFTVDHGIEAARDKWYCYDPGIGVALIMRWPDGHIPAGQTYDHLTSNIDFLPTILALIGAPIPDNVEGRSFAEVLLGRAEGPLRMAAYGVFQSKEQRYMRTDRYKFIRSFAPHRVPPVPAGVGAHLGARVPKAPVAQLFDLQTDPLETTNLATEPAYTDTFREMSDRLADWMEAVNDPILHGPTPTPYYQEAMAHFQQSRRMSWIRRDG